MAFEILVALALIIIVLLWRIEHNELHKIINKLPGPPVLPILGNIQELSAVGADFLKVVDDVVKKFYNEGIFRFWIGPFHPIIVCHKPETVEVLLNSSKHMTKSELYEFLHPWLGTGLLTSDGDKWRSRRKLLTPAFHFKILTSFCQVFNEQARVLVSRLNDIADDRTVNIFPYVTLCTLDVICDTAMGCHVGSQNNAESPYAQAVKKVSEITMKRLKSFWLFPDLIFYNLPIGREYKHCLKILHGFTDKVIRDKSKEIENEVGGKSLAEELAKDGDALIGSKKRLAFLDLLLYSRKNDHADISDSDIREEVDTFMFEGHDTTASGVSWTLYLLGRHQEVQKRVYDEIYSVLGDGDSEISLDDIKQLKYLECVIKESLRLYPPVPWFARKVTEPCKIDKYDMPSGVTVLVNAWAIHRRADIFPNPEQFNPDRWSSEGLHDRHPYCYIPFSAGFRNCIGQKFAMNEEKVLIASVLRKFSLKSTQEESSLRLLTDLILRPEDGIFIQLQKRTTLIQ